MMQVSDNGNIPDELGVLTQRCKIIKTVNGLCYFLFIDLKRGFSLWLDDWSRKRL